MRNALPLRTLRGLGWVCVVLCMVLGVGLLEAATSRPTTRPASSHAPKRLQLLNLWPLDTHYRRFDPSGLVLLPDEKELLTVNDKAKTLQIFSIAVPSAKAPKPTSLPVRLKVRSNYRVHLPFSPVWPRFRYYLDLEGVTYCDGHILVVAEQLRHVFRINPATGTATQHPLALASYERKTALRSRPMPRFSIDPNAGFEGLACDPKHRRLYIIQERQPRLILVASLPSTWTDKAPLTLIDHFDLPSFGLPKPVKGVDLDPDFAGADVRDGLLYVLYRNARLVLKVDPLRHALLDAYSYGHVEKTLYRVPKPYGLAEGLAIGKDRIWIVFDNNNRARLSPPIRDYRPVLLEMQRPTGF